MSDRGLEIRNLSKQFPNGTHALIEVDLDVPVGQIAAVIGPSGAGKSTLLRCINRLAVPTAGTIRLGGTDLGALRGRELARARRGIGFVFQQFNLIRSYTVLDNVLSGRIGYNPMWRNLLRSYSDEDVAIAREAVVSVGLADKMDIPARELSGGQQQRVSIARVFAQQPALILADEPTASLDPALAGQVLELLVSLSRQKCASVLLNLHQIELAERYCDRVIAMRAGEIVWDGVPAALTREVLRSIYGVDLAEAAPRAQGEVPAGDARAPA
jgi:phosphonate transport system ATP-binding protein